MPVCASLPPPGSNLGMYRVALVNFLMNTHNFPPRCNARTFVLVYSYVFSQSISGAGPAYLPQLMSRASSQSNRLRRACNQGPRLSPHPTNGAVHTSPLFTATHQPPPPQDPSCSSPLLILFNQRAARNQIAGHDLLIFFLAP